MGYLLDAIKSFFEWLLTYIKDILNTLLMPLAEKLPDMSFDFSPVSPYVAFVNSWIALDTGLFLLASYFIFIIVMISVKLIVKLFIPTVG